MSMRSPGFNAIGRESLRPLRKVPLELPRSARITPLTVNGQARMPRRNMRVIEMKLHGSGVAANHASLAYADPLCTQRATQYGHVPGIDLHRRIGPARVAWSIVRLFERNNGDRRAGKAKADTIADINRLNPINHRIVEQRFIAVAQMNQNKTARFELDPRVSR